MSANVDRANGDNRRIVSKHIQDLLSGFTRNANTVKLKHGTHVNILKALVTKRRNAYPIGFPFTISSIWFNTTRAKIYLINAIPRNNNDNYHRFSNTPPDWLPAQLPANQ